MVTECIQTTMLVYNHSKILCVLHHNLCISEEALGNVLWVNKNICLCDDNLYSYLYASQRGCTHYKVIFKGFGAFMANNQLWPSEL
jgi:hypothetical protein